MEKLATALDVDIRELLRPDDWLPL
jgi:hypothetical protein